MAEQSFVQRAPVQFQGLPVNWSVTDFARLITIKIGAASIKMQLHGNPVVPCANSHNHDSSSPELFSYCSHSSWPTAITRNAVRLNQQRDDQVRRKEHYLLITGVFNLVFSIRPYIDRILARFSFLRAKWILYWSDRWNRYLNLYYDKYRRFFIIELISNLYFILTFGLFFTFTSCLGKEPFLDIVIVSSLFLALLR